MAGMRHGPGRVGRTAGSRMLIAGLLCLSLVRTARGQETAPDTGAAAPAEPSWTLDLLRPKKTWLQRFHLGRWRSTLQFGFQWNQQHTTSTGATDVSSDYLDFRELMTIGNGGFLFHPGLLEFNTDLALGFTQNSTSAPGSDSSSDGRLLGYSVNGTFLRDKPLNLQVFGNRGENTFNRGFGGTATVLAENYGTTLRWRKAFRKVEVGFREERVEEQDSLLDVPGQDERRRVAFLRASGLGEVSDVDLSYDFQDVVDYSFAASSFQSHVTDLSHRYAFGEYLEGQLTSDVSLFRREGGMDRTGLRASESLQLNHSDTLWSNYSYDFDFNDDDEFRDTRHSGEFSVVHRLYGSLQSRLGMNASYWQPEAGRIVEYGPNVSVGYSRRLPREGSFSVDGGVSYDVTDQRLDGDELPVFQEPHKVTGFQLIFLTTPGIVRDSILVTDSAATTIFREGIDYRVVELGDRIALERLPSGNWKNDTEILVDYVFLTSGRLKVGTLGRLVRTSIDYPWFSLFFRRTASSSDQFEGDPGTYFEDVTDQLVGLQVRWTRQRLDLDSGADYHWYDSDTTAYNGVRVNEGITGRPWSRVSLSAYSVQAFNKFSIPQDRDTLELSARLAGTWRVRTNVNLEMSAGWLSLDDSSSPAETVVDGSVGLSWEIGRLRISPRFSVANREVDDSSTTGLQATLWMSRQLF